MSSGRFAAANFSRTFSTRSSSTQPPDTEPMIWPSPRMATIAPIGRGADPHVLTMVPSATRWPLVRQASAVRRTSMSTLSMRKCYRNAAAAIAGAIGNNNVRAMASRDLAHDREAKAAARARRSRHAVAPLEHALALRVGNTGAVVLDFDHRLSVATPGAHGDAAAAVRALDRVVHEVGEGFAQQERVARHAHRLELEAEVDVARE